MGVVGLDEALDLVVLVAEVAPDRLEGFARRWLVRLADERPLWLAEARSRGAGAPSAAVPPSSSSLRALVL